MSKIEYAPPKRKQRVWRVVKKIFGWFYKKPTLVVKPNIIEDKSIIVANHCSKQGPLIYDLYFPKYIVKWGAHQMLGNYSSRKKYLKEVYYMRKKGFGERKAGFKGGFEAIFSKYLYRGVKVIGTYEDLRFRNTIKKSMNVINDNTPVMIYPENSNAGYFEILTEFFAGFVVLAEQYYKSYGVDLPIYPTYYHEKKRVMLIDNPLYVQDFVRQGKNRKEIAEIFRLKVNALHDEIEKENY